MAHIENPRKVFCWTIDFPAFPINPFLFQEGEIPEVEVDSTAHGDANYDVKTGGRKKFGDIVLKKLITTDPQGDTYFFDWQILVQDALTGGGLTPLGYKRTCIIKELAEDGISVINTWVCTGVWPKKISGQKQDRLSSDNTIEEITLSVDIVDKV